MKANLSKMTTEERDQFYMDAGRERGGKCYAYGCTSPSTHYNTSNEKWYCYHCSVVVNGRHKKRVCITSKDLTAKILTGEVKCQSGL